MIWESARWFDGSGNSLNFEEIITKVSKYKGYEIHVGSDSQPVKEGVVFAVALCLYSPGKGAFYFVTRKSSKEKQFKNLGIRLHHESELGISLADQVRAITGDQEITVHADVNSNPIFRSSKYSTKIQNFIKAMGFKCIIKPDSWAAWVADKHAK